jgi:hypothetical protein
MALTHVTAIRNSLADLVVDAIDVGTTDAQGDLVIMTSGDVEVATINLSATSFGAASSGTATMADVPLSDTNATGGTAALFMFQDRDNNEVVRGSVTATGGGGDLQLSSTTIGATDTVTINSFTYSASA